VFTGVIHHIGTISTCEKKGDLRITVECDLPIEDLRIGDSIACNGCCLTVITLDTKIDREEFQREVRLNSFAKIITCFTATLSEETLRCTAPRWNVGDKLHLERALRMGDTLDGHMVSGHVDGLATLLSITQDADSHRLEFEVPTTLSCLIAAKGSVTLDGVSLTVNAVDGNRFSVNIIPHTWNATSFRERKVGDTLNCEIDLIARYVQRLLGK